MTKTIHFHRGTLNQLERYLIILVLVGDFVIELSSDQWEHFYPKCIFEVYTWKN